MAGVSLPWHVFLPPLFPSTLCTLAWQYLTSGTLNHDLGHVNDIAQGLNVISLPAPDGFIQDLQLQLFPFPYILTLGLEDSKTLLKETNFQNCKFWPYCFVSYFFFKTGNLLNNVFNSQAWNQVQKGKPLK